MGRSRRGLVLGTAASALLIGGALVVAAPAGDALVEAAPHEAHPPGLLMHPQVRTESFVRATRPPTEAFCMAHFGILCYGPSQVEAAYDEQPLLHAGLDGHGETIVVVDSFGAPTIRRDLAVFDRYYGLTAPPRFTIMKYGPVPVYTPSIPTATGWAEETTLDVEWSHAIAPGANILLVETATPETVGVTGFPTIVNAENYVIDHHLGDVISQSFAAGEPTFKSPAQILRLRSSLENAYRNKVTVVSATGDTGVAVAKTVTKTSYFPYRGVSWPASDPLVTAVGGTQLSLDTAGRRTAPDRAWNDSVLLTGPAATSGGMSTVFSRPSYQKGVAGVVGSRRGVPDISMSASVSGSVETYISGLPFGAGWLAIGGTSEATPEFAGIVAIADQVNGHQPLGMIDPALYAMGAAHDPGISSVTGGTNTVSFTTHGKVVTLQGYKAGPGYNLATGLGTVDAPEFVRELVSAVHAVGTTVHYGDSPGAFFPHS